MKNCLVVGESRVIRKVACKILGEMQFDTEEAEESVSALEACRTRMPDVVLMDLAHLGGIEFLRALRREKSATQPVIVFATTENDVLQISEALGAGADQYLLKPFDGEAMRSKFSEVGLAA